MIADNQRTLEAAQHVLGHYDVPGFPKAGSFTTGLIDLMGRADPQNKTRLLFAFPEYRPALDALATMPLEAVVLIVREAENARRDAAARAAQVDAARATPAPVYRKIKDQPQA